MENNQILFKVDISNNPIGPEGAKKLLKTLYEYNNTLGDLGDLSDSYYMGVRIRQDLQQAIELNNTSHAKKQAFMEQVTANTRTKNVDSGQHQNPLADKATKKEVPLSVQKAYPIRNPITFSNIFGDDYIDSGVWSIK